MEAVWTVVLKGFHTAFGNLGASQLTSLSTGGRKLDRLDDFSAGEGSSEVLC